MTERATPRSLWRRVPAKIRSWAERGAYQWGLAVVRRAVGLPRANVVQLADQVKRYVAEYEKDPRLHSKKKKPSPSASPSKPSPTLLVPSSAAPPSTSPPSASPSAAPSSAASTAAFDPNARYQIRNAWAGAVLEVPDGENTASGTRIQLWNNNNENGQYWRIAKATTAGYVMIINDCTGQALAMENESMENQAKVVVATKSTSAETQQWKLTDAGDGKVSITNRKSGKVMELLGDDLGPPLADGTWNGYWVEQYDPVPTANRDQFWLLVN